MDTPIYVTQPALPPLEEFHGILKNIWASRVLTNNGPYHQQLEEALCAYLGVKYVSLFSNGTLALITALQTLRITGEVITTPFSFVATTHALHWNEIKPVFVDVEPHTFNLDPEKIEAAITQKTTAILPVHVYGNPCAVQRLQQIAETYGLKLIYDAAHAFGVSAHGASLLNWGDLSILSFHATKVYTTFEGGAIVCQDAATKRRIDFLKNFGFADEVTVVGPGINAKMNEVQSAMGLLQLKYVDGYIAKRAQVALRYREQLAGVPGLDLLYDLPGVRHVYSYFPVLIDAHAFGCDRDGVYQKMRSHNIFTRRYFYPLISQFPTYKSLESARPGNLPVAESVSRRVLCLPIYPDLAVEQQNEIIARIKDCQGGGYG
jgi:dTDP-4-amino-4,6-dideoxygalactose transaminase